MWHRLLLAYYALRPTQLPTYGQSTSFPGVAGTRFTYPGGMEG